MKKFLRALPLLKSSRGQSLVEFAMVLPLLLVVGFIITEFGRALWTKNVLTEAAGNGARAAIVSGTATYAQVATDAANRFLRANNMGTDAEVNPSTVDVELLAPEADGVQAIRVTISRTFSFVPGGGEAKQLGAGPFAEGTGKATFGTFTITGEARMDTQPSFAF